MRYDYIFSGMGLSTLMILHKMIRGGACNGKTVLIIEADEKNQNDKTWCFWEKGDGEWDFLLKKSWQEAFFISDEVKVNCLKDGYEYKMLESKVFCNFVLQEIKECDDIHIVHDKVNGFEESGEFVLVSGDENQYETRYFFNSVLDRNVIQNNVQFPLLQQHFVGWFVQTNMPVFNDNQATFMDFSVGQKGNTRFMYVLPTSATEALVEYTLFSPDLLSEEEYEAEISAYLKSRGINDFKIAAKEKGNIPMTSYPFWNNNSKRILHIGSAGGWTKASTGYTFKNADKLSDEIVKLLRNEIVDFTQFKTSDRFTFYDRLFVKVLYNENAVGKLLFTKMFSKVRPDKILRFLDEESSVTEDLQVIWACPKWPFIRALFKK